jgi:hypothetical protein
MKTRNYKKEYEEYQGRPEQIKRRAGRNSARRKVLNGSKSFKDVHHVDGNPKNNSRRNLRLISKGRNRSRK